MPGTLDDLRAALSERYRIERELGRGVMATVYLAEDLKHGRRVAIKVLRPELTAMLGEERFLNEIRVTAQLQHPNIVPLYDSGATAGLLYYVMPFIEGESVRDRIDREGPLPVTEAVAIARAIASALAYAHQRGVIHRDIKPANILLQAGTTLVADFGIALALDSAVSDRLTTTGLSVGTPAYMSPEQAAGDRAVRPTLDVYALGCVLYEMLAGEPPFTGSHAPALMARIMSERPTRIRTLRPTVPESVEAAVDRALAKLPADRFQQISEFGSALVADEGAVPFSKRDGAQRVRRAARVVAAVVVLGLAVRLVLGRPGVGGAGTDARVALPTSPTDDPRPAIAVLSFADMSPAHDQEYFSDGISEEILSALSRIRNLRVAARSTAFTYKGRDLDLRQVGKALGVQYLLAGSVRKDGDQLRISAELVNATDGFRVWAQTYERRLQGVFAIQSEIAAAISEALRVPLGLSREELVSATLDMTAHDLYLSGRAALQRRGRGVAEALRLFEASVEHDSSWAPAWAGLAEAWAIRPLYEGNAGESTDSATWDNSLRAAEAAARRALSLDPRNSAARVDSATYTGIAGSGRMGNASSCRPSSWTPTTTRRTRSTRSCSGGWAGSLNPCERRERPSPWTGLPSAWMLMRSCST